MYDGLLSKERLNKLLSFAKLGSWDVYPDTREFICFGEPARRLELGRDGCFSFDDFYKIVLDDYREIVQTGIDELDKKPFEERLPIWLPDRSVVWVNLTIDMIERDADGISVAYGFMYIIDNNNIKEVQLYSNKNYDIHSDRFLADIYSDNVLLFNSLFNKLPVGLEVYDKFGNLIAINDRDLEILGIPNREMVLGISLFKNPNVSDDIMRLLRRGENVDFRLRYDLNLMRHLIPNIKEGGFKDIVIKITVLRDAEGLIQNYLCLIIDDSDKETSLTKVKDFTYILQMISEYAKVGYAKLNVLTSEGYASDQWFRNLGEYETTSVTDVAGIYSKMSIDDRQQILQFYKDVAAGRATAFKREVRIIEPDGSFKWILVNVMLCSYAPHENDIQIIGVNYEITELKEVEFTLLKAKSKAEEMDKLKSAFIANMSHEIRTPLNAIIGFSRLMIDEEVSIDEKQEYLSIVETNNELLLQLISDILDLSKIEAGEYNFTNTDIDVDRLCEEVITALQFKVQHGVELIYEGSNADCNIVCDKNKLFQVLSNMVGNALKFTHSGSVRVGCIGRGDALEFYVNDTGVGIPDHMHKLVFDRFVKVNSMSQGSGLGLAICKTIVDQFGGDIGVESNSDGGSRFWFTVPRANDVVGETKTTIEHSVAGDADALQNNRHVVLVAEDTDSNYLLIKAILKNAYDLHRACDGVEAVELYETLKPDLILMDVRMPHVDGLEATRRIRAKGATIPIIALTAFAFEHDRQAAFEAGCTDFMTKPVSAGKLREVLAQAVSK